MEASVRNYVAVTKPPRSGGSPVDIEKAVTMLAAAERPYVYVGAGVLNAGASTEFVRTR